MTFQGKLIQNTKRSPLIYLVTAQANDRNAWYYVQIEEPKHAAFKKQLAMGALDLAHFGTVLYSGWGDAPPEPVDALVRDTFDPVAA